MSILPSVSGLIAQNSVVASNGTVIKNTSTSGKYVLTGNASQPVQWLPVRQNWLKQSQALATAPWGTAGTAPTVTNNTTDVTDPLGGNTATKVVYPNAGTTLLRQTSVNPPPGTYALSCWIRGVSSGTVYMLFADGAVTPYVTANFTNGWTRISGLVTITTTGSFVDFGINTGIAGQSIQPAQTVYFWGAQLEPLFLTPYIPTTSSTVTIGCVAVEPNGLLIEPSITNLVSQSQALATTPWSELHSAVATTVTNNTTDVTAPDGTNTASKLVIPAVSAGGAYSILRQTPNQAASTYTLSGWVRGSSTGTIYLYFSDGTYHTVACNYTTTWQRFSVTATTTANMGILDIGVNLNDGQQAAQPAQTVYVWGIQLEAQGYASSYIPTTTGSVLRQPDIVVFNNPLATNAPIWSVSVNTRELFPAGSAAYVISSGVNGTANSWNAYVQGRTSFQTQDASNNAKNCGTTPVSVDGNAHTMILKNVNGTISCFFDANPATTFSGTGTGVVPQAATLQLGGLNGNFVGGPLWVQNVVIRNK